MAGLEELYRFSKEKKKKKTKLSAEDHDKAIELFKNGVLDRESDFAGVLEAMDSLPPLVVGDIVGIVWEEMPEERKILLLRWASRRDSEKNLRRMAFVAASLLSRDSKASVSLLERLLPQDDSAARSQELRQALRVSFLTKSDVKLQNLCTPTLPDSAVVRICRALLECLDKTVPWAQHNAMSQIIAEIISRGHFRSDSGRLALVSGLESEIKTWPVELQRKFVESVQSAVPALTELFPAVRQNPSPLAEGRPKGAPGAPQTTPVLGAGELANSKISVENLIEEIETRIGRLRSELQVYSGLRDILRDVDRIQSEAMQADELKVRVQQLSERLQVLEQTRSEAFERISTLERDVANAQQQVQQVSADLNVAKQERDHLVAQVKAHAEVEIEQFKNRLGGNLSRMVGDLPVKHADLSPASSQVLLRQYHQFLDKLEEQGVRVRTRKENQ